MNSIMSVARATFLEGVRNKIFYNLALFAFLILASSLVLHKMTVGDETKIIKDLGLASIAIFGLLIATFVGSNLIAREVEEKVIYTILSKPLSRGQYFVGKFLGIVMIIGVNTVAMTALTLLFVYSVGGGIPWALVLGALLIFAELVVVTAMTAFFLTFMGSTICIYTVLMLYVVGHSTTEVRKLLQEGSSLLMAKIVDAAYYILPNFDHFDIKSLVVHGLRVPPEHVAFAISYGIGYTGILLIFGYLIFKNREF